MNTAQTSLLFFYGIFWASSLNAIDVFRPFATHRLFKKETIRTSFFRFVASIFIANVLPIAGLYALYNSVLMSIETSAGILISAIASLSVFSIPRILHGVILNKCSATWFYTKDEIKELKEGSKKKNPDPCFHHLLPGIIYIVVPIGLAFFILYKFKS